MVFDDKLDILRKTITEVFCAPTRDQLVMVCRYADCYINNFISNSQIKDTMTAEQIHESTRAKFQITEGCYDEDAILALIGAYVGNGIINDADSDSYSYSNYEMEALKSIIAFSLAPVNQNHIWDLGTIIHNQLAEVYIRYIRRIYTAKLTGRNWTKFGNLEIVDFLQGYFVATELRYGKVKSHYNQLLQLRCL